MRKYDWRSEVFVSKLQNGTPFQSKAGEVVLSYSDETANVITNGSLKDLRALRIDGYKLSDLVKCSDFGGKSDNGTVKEQFALNKLNEQITNIKMSLGKSSIPVAFRDQTFNITHAVDTPGTPKSDFHLVDENDQEVFWISHKDGKSAKCFQQWGGLSAKTESRINQHPETQEFISEIKRAFPEGVPRATTVGKIISDDTLKHLSVYGNEYPNAFGRQNVQAVIQGDVSIDRIGNYYEVSGSIAHYNGQLISGSYEPIFIATMRNDRNNEGIPCTRLSIAPKDGRKITAWL